jgi:DNA-binding transcriptional MerR regulator
MNPLHQTSKSNSLGLISIQEESAVLRRRKLLRRLQDVNLSPEEAQTLLERVTTNSSSAADRERLATLIRATTEVSEQLLAEPAMSEPPVPERLSLQRTAKRKRQSVKVARRRNRR